MVLMRNTFMAVLLLLAALARQGSLAVAAEPPVGTSLSDPALRYTVPEKPYVVLKRGGVAAVIVDNRACDDAVLPGHRAGYSGVAALRHGRRKENLFVPAYAGLNFEHIHDGTVQTDDVLFEPRRAAMELRVVGEHAAELYQKPTPHWGLESCQRYELLADGTIRLTIEVIPRKKAFKHGYIGLFWASYIDRPESLDIHFKGVSAADAAGPAVRIEWVRGVTPAHGKLPTHRAIGDKRVFAHDEKFPLTLVFNESKHRYGEPWYFGVSQGMAFVQMFRPADAVLISQSPSGGGHGCPAWDFQFFIANYEVNCRYQFVMRAAYLPFESAEQIEKATATQRKLSAE